MLGRKENSVRHGRFIALGVFFAVVCCVFLFRLIYYQLASPDKYASAVTATGNTRSVTVIAQRGNICDRNGNVLVKNTFTYNIQIEYGALPESVEEAYESYLGALDFIDEVGAKRDADVFALTGNYPNYSYVEAAYDTDSVIFKRLVYVLRQYFPSECEGLDDSLLTSRISASELGALIAQKHSIVSFDKKGNVIFNYSERDTERLISLRYNMVAGYFGIMSPYVLVRDADDRTAAAIQERHLSGITVRAVANRTYNYKKADGTRYAEHILGTVGRITAENSEYYTSLGYSLDAVVGRSGCELAFEEYLHGVDGEMAIVYDDRGRVIDTYYITEPIAGRDVYLTIDINVQMEAENSLDSKISSDSGVGGAVAATDVNTGEILALASGPNGELNRAISAYAPGSTFKVGVALAALNEGIINQYSNIATYGSYNGMKCSHYMPDGSCCGNINTVKALERSCNYFFAYLGDIMGLDTLTRYATVFGFGQNTGIEIGLNASVAESTGGLTDKEELDYMAAIGQLSTATPLQISQYIAMVANGGTRYSAHLLYAVVDYETGEVLYTPEKVAVASFSALGIKDEDVATVKAGMYSVVYGEDASSYVYDAFKSATYTVAGKTGTAQVSGQTDNALFTAFAPYESPKIAVTCFIEQGQTGGLASSVVRNVMDAYSSHVSSLGQEQNNGAQG